MRHSIKRVPRLAGIGVCPEWQDYANYEDWCFKNGWKPGMCIVRIDKGNDFCPENCKLVPARKFISKERRNLSRLPDGRTIRELCGEAATLKEFNRVRRRVLDLKWDADISVKVPANGISRSELYMARKEGRSPFPALTNAG